MGCRARTERVRREKVTVAFGRQEWLSKEAVGERERPRGSRVWEVRVRPLMRICRELMLLKE